MDKFSNLTNEQYLLEVVLRQRIFLKNSIQVFFFCFHWWLNILSVHKVWSHPQHAIYAVLWERRSKWVSLQVQQIGYSIGNHWDEKKGTDEKYKLPGGNLLLPVHIVSSVWDGSAENNKNQQQRQTWTSTEHYCKAVLQTTKTVLVNEDENLNKQVNENNQQNLDPKLAMPNCQRLKERSAWHPYRLPCVSSAASACIFLLYFFFLFFFSFFFPPISFFFFYTYKHTHSFYIAHIESNKTKQAKNSIEIAVQGHLSEQFFSFFLSYI